MDKILLNKNNVLFVLFAILAISLFSPIASNSYFPNSNEFANHLVSISEAKKALLAGQFPIRVTPSIGEQYPYFQFYSPFPYMIAGFFDIYLNNPLIAYKFTLWFALLFAGFYFAALIKLFIQSDAAALLGAVAYLTSPFLLIDMTARGDFTESFAICLLPAVLYHSIAYLREKDFFRFLLVAVFWSLLATSHLVTFIFSALFIGVFLLVIQVFENLPFKNLTYLLLAVVFSCLLSFWYLMPILIFHSDLYVQAGLVNPAHANWLTPLSTILSPVAMSPMSLPGNGKLHFPLYFGIGLVALFSIGLTFFLKISRKKTPYYISFLLLYCLITFGLIWSPVDFWKFLPNIFNVLQFSFRLFIPFLWMSCILLAWSINELLNQKIELKHLVLALFLMIFANSSWLISSPSFPKSVSELTSKPVFVERSALTYLLNPNQIAHDKVLLPLANCHSEKMIHCDVNLSAHKKIALPLDYYPRMLSIKLDGKDMPYVPAVSHLQNDIKENLLLPGLDVPAGHHIIEAKFTGLEYANEISLFCWIFVTILFAARLLITLMTFKNADITNFDKNGADL